VAVTSGNDLYGLPLERFIPERTALAKALRAAKEREEADRIAALRKPSVAAWAVNQLVRTQGKKLRALFAAGDQLARAQTGGGSGPSRVAAMRKASAQQRAALDQLVDAARGLLNADGHPLSTATLDRVIDTLRAAAIHGASREQVSGGCLTQELAFAGLGIGEFSLGAPDEDEAPATECGRRRERTTERRGAQRRERATERPAAPQRERERERERRAALKAASADEERAQRTAARAERELAAAHSHRDEAAEELAEAERRLASAADRAKTAAAKLADAERAVKRAQSNS
jgi:hypothetical protein